MDFTGIMDLNRSNMIESDLYPPKDFAKGVAIYTRDDFTNPNQYTPAIRELRSWGFNAIQLCPVVTNANGVFSLRFTDQYIETILDTIKAEGFETVMIKMHMSARLTNASVVTLASYKNVLIHYAKMAERHNVDYFMYANEQFSATNTARSSWEDIYRSIKDNYSGLTGISLAHEEEKTAIIMDLNDVVGFNIYPSMTYDPDVSKVKVQDCANAWYFDIQTQHNYIQSMRDIKEKYNVSILITETGIQSQWGRLAYPGVNNQDTVYSEETQHMFYKATMPIISGLKDTIDGYFLWEMTNSSMGAKNLGYNFKGKSSLDLIRQYL